MTQLGRAISVITQHYELEAAYACDLHMFGAPSECYADAGKYLKRRLREARRMARGLAGVGSWRRFKITIRKSCPTIERVLYCRYGITI